MSAHAQFEEYCVLSTSGQLNAVEAEALDEHLHVCSDCRRFLKDVRLLSATAVPRMLASTPVEMDVPRGMRDRFFARAAGEGIRIHAALRMWAPTASMSISAISETFEQPAAQASSSFAWSRLAQYWRPMALAASACAVCFALGSMVRTHDKAVSPIAASHANPVTSSVPVAVAVLNANTDAQSDVSRTSAKDLDILVQQRTQLESELEAANKEKRDLEEASQQKIVALGEDATRDHQTLMQQSALLNSRVQVLQAQLDALQQKQVQTEAILTVQEQETRKYSSQAADLQAKLANLPPVSPINPDEVQNLVAARNLHIIDVYDSDGVGNRQRAFGRVFYVEGRSLVFYAYDLGKAHTEKKIIFHVWGAHANDVETTISLGVLHAEDQGEQRWALTFDDPKALAKINSVFVTIEPSNRDVIAPTGKKVLYAFLGEKANHP